MLDMELLNTLDDATLERISQSNYTELDYEVYSDHSSLYDYDNTDVDISNSTIFGNCTETLWNVTLVPRSLRMNHHYKVVRQIYLTKLKYFH